MLTSRFSSALIRQRNGCGKYTSRLSLLYALGGNQCFSSQNNLKLKVYQYMLLFEFEYYAVHIQYISFHIFFFFSWLPSPRDSNTMCSLASRSRKEIGTWVELGLKADSCNSISLCKETHIIIVEQRAALSPRVGHHQTELGKQILVFVFFLLSLAVYFLFELFCHPLDLITWY